MGEGSSDTGLRYWYRSRFSYKSRFYYGLMGMLHGIFRHFYLCSIVVLSSSLILCGILVLPSVATAQTAGSANAIGLGSTGVAAATGSGDFWSNPSILARTAPAVSVSWVQFAGLNEFSSIRATIAFRVREAIFGAGIRRFGSDFYHRTSFHLATAYSIGDLHLGASSLYRRVYQGHQYQPLHSISVQTGFLLRLSDSVYIGFRANNLLQSRYLKTNEQLPSDLAAGLEVRMHKTLHTTLDFVKDLRYPLSLRWGVVWEPVANIRFLAGQTMRPETFSIGLSILWDSWRGTFAFQQHTPLGLTPAIDLEYILP